ncbi:protein kinase:ABC1 family [Ectocarpus siliculosus]|uniref:Protein kinase:ABC1 family n=1 Tax=Ectocarpus siliculosus TaxID=2880 RepID=D8LK12_ECTSI|nr:protein kinase:ABC1 family [Ectocarpus siliculosus]|eukprot:CBN74481.1 protein kinase:ABC1 family [Ectocarpus siliculosus]
MSASDAFDVNAALAELRASASSAAQSQLPPSQQPSLPPLPSFELPKGVQIPTPSQVLDAIPKLTLPSLPELPAGAAQPSTANLLPPELLQPTGDTWIFSRLSEAATKASESSLNAASRLLPPTPDKYAQLATQISDSCGRASLQVSNALDALVVANPSLAPAVAHLRSSLTDALASLGEAYAAGDALIPEEYKPFAATLVIGAGATALGMSMAALSEEGKVSREAKNAPLPREYDLPAIMNYYNSRPLTLLSRLAEVSYRLGSLAAKLWLDRKVGDGSGWEKNMDSRATEFVEFVQGAGPAFIKIGQGVSIRPDILPEPYLKELSKLQDRVNPFDSGDARRILEQQLGKPLREIFLDADTAFEIPVAAASLGQVYKATLVTGEVVAVKVQRPDVLESVTLDLYVIRLLLLFIAKNDSTRESALSILGVIDNWADRFLQELDYLQEAANGDRFRREMAESKTLGEAILVPQVYTSLNTRYILVTEWVEGVKVDAIDSSTPAGRERLKKIVATLLNSYLAQLLESGFLHADPHPGNFLCTPDGRLCVLDMGLMTEVGEDQRYALLEYVSHLTAKDYEATLYDLIVLGFIPEEIGQDPEKAGIVAPLLATVLEQLSNGGGAKSVTVETVGEEVEELGRQYPIRIPAYFGLIIRAFSALEGLGLQLDEQYSIVNECFPYLARRLLTEDSDRMHKMLRTFLYGKDGRYLKVDRVDDLVDGYSQFTALADEASKGLAVDGVKDPLGRTSHVPTATAAATAAAATTASAETPTSQQHTAASSSSRRRQGPQSPAPLFGGGGGGGGGGAPASVPAFASAGATSVAGAAEGAPGGAMAVGVDPIQDPVARDALKLLFSKEGNYVQELVVEELVRMTDALSREANLQIIQALRTLTEAPLSPARIARALAEAPMNPLLAPLQIPVKVQSFALSRIFNRLEVALELTQEDQESLKALRRLQQLLQGGINNDGGENSSSSSSSSRGVGFPLPPSPAALLSGGGSIFPSGFSLQPGAAVGPREAVDAARQAAGLASMIGPGVASIAQKFLVQLAARTLDRLADSFDEQGNKDGAGGATTVEGVASGVREPASTQRGRFYADESK